MLFLFCLAEIGVSLLFLTCAPIAIPVYNFFRLIAKQYLLKGCRSHWSSFYGVDVPLSNIHLSHNINDEQVWIKINSYTRIITCDNRSKYKMRCLV